MIDVRLPGIWMTSNDERVWLSAWIPDRHATSAYIAPQDGSVQPFGDVYNFRPFAIADGRVWFVAGPGDGAAKGVCGMRLDTQQVDECADVMVGDLEILREPLGYDAGTNSLWAAGNGAQVYRIDLNEAA